MRWATPIRPDDTAATLHDRLTYGARALTHAQSHVEGLLKPQPQPEEAQYAPTLKKKQGHRLDGACRGDPGTCAPTTLAGTFTARR